MMGPHFGLYLKRVVLILTDWAYSWARVVTGLQVPEPWVLT